MAGRLKLLPYCAPMLPEFRGASFRRNTRLWRPRINELLGGTVPAYWAFQSHRPPSARPWRPKLYVCVGSRHYWPCVAKLLRALPPRTIRWKFLIAERHFERPDKIVIYPSSVEELRSIITVVRPLLRGCSTHDLCHAALTSRLGLERRDRKGLFVGCDPGIIREMGGWRRYRAIVNAWAERNEPYLESLPGGRFAWLRRMNLSPNHEGPASLEPDPKDVPFIRRYWRLMMPRSSDPDRRRGRGRA